MKPATRDEVLAFLRSQSLPPRIEEPTVNSGSNDARIPPVCAGDVLWWLHRQPNTIGVLHASAPSAGSNLNPPKAPPEVSIYEWAPMPGLPPWNKAIHGMAIIDPKGIVWLQVSDGSLHGLLDYP